MYKYFKVSCLLFLLPFISFSQNSGQDPVLLEIAGEKITKNEFLRTYFKNSPNNNKISSQEDLDNYLDLYINYRLKVKQAKDLHLDTAKSFVWEYEKYRSQLAQPYLFDKEVNDQLIKEAYDRMKWQFRASHILFRVNANAFPQDTLATYKKAMEVRNKILAGMPFEQAADEYSDDQSVRDQAATPNSPAVKGNHGDLGYFSAFDMIYPFETGVYNTKVGEISMPVRTPFGYHLIKVVKKEPAMGYIHAAHIMIATPQNMNSQDSVYYKNKINFVAKKLQQGESFVQMTKEYSDDKGTSDNGGTLPAFTPNRMVPEFIDAIIPLKEGDISEPFLTRFGWHIALLIKKEEIPPFDSLETDLAIRVSKDSRSNKPKESFVERLKNEYHFQENKNALEEFHTIIPDSIFQGKWDRTSANSLQKELFHLGDKSYSQQEFADYIATKYQRQGDETTINFINRSYKDFVQESCIKYEEGQLERKYDEFRELSNEYHDGFLLFDLTDLKVWNKAIQDSTGLEKFYEENKSRYQWGERVDATIFEFEKDRINEKKALKMVNTAYKKKILSSSDKIDKLINKTFPGNDTLNIVRYQHDKYSKGDNRLIDKITWKQGVAESFVEADRYLIIIAVQQVLPPRTKELNETRGVVIADYQGILEKQWLEELKATYPVIIHRDVYNTIK